MLYKLRKFCNSIPWIIIFCSSISSLRESFVIPASARSKNRVTFNQCLRRVSLYYMVWERERWIIYIEREREKDAPASAKRIDLLFVVVHRKQKYFKPFSPGYNGASGAVRTLHRHTGYAAKKESNFHTAKKARQAVSRRSAGLMDTLARRWRRSENIGLGRRSGDGRKRNKTKTSFRFAWDLRSNAGGPRKQPAVFYS